MIEAKVTGIAEFKDALLAIVPKLRRRAILNALRVGARIVQAEAKRNAPVLRLGTKAPYRKPGTVRGAIAVRTSKRARAAGDVGVFVNVRPAKGAKYGTFKGAIGGKKVGVKFLKSASKRGAKSPDDPFYWRFLEFGTKKMGARPFLQKGAERLGQALIAIEKALGPQIEKLNKNPKDPL